MVVLSPGIIANGLSFFRDYTLIGGNLTLAGTIPTVAVDWLDRVRIDSPVQGVDGLVKSGGGTLRLGNSANSYTGTTAINNGILLIQHAGALGNDTSAIAITGSTTRGLPGGALMLEGGYTSGIALTRGVTLQGFGPVPANGAALLSVGSNTISGLLSNGSGTASTALNSAGGLLTLSDVAIAGVTNTAFMTFGVVNGVGTGGYNLTGALTGTGTLQKLGGGTLFLNPTDARGFGGTIRVTGGSVRVSSVASLGSNAGSGSASPIDLAGDNAVLELRMDNPTIGRNVFVRAGGSPILFVDHAIGSSVINATATFGNLNFDDGETLTFNGRNGFGVTINNPTVLVGDGNSSFTNNMSGLLTMTGNFWNNSNTTAARTLTFGGTGNTVLEGGIIAEGGAGFDHIFTKSGAGTLTVLGTNSTLDGAVNVNGGTLAITDFRSLTNNSSTIHIGTTTTAGILTIGTSSAATAAGLTTSKVINLAGTTGAATINANQSGDDPIIFQANFTALGVGVKSLTLGGSNASNNAINGAIVDSTGNWTNLRKSGAGQWVLAGANTFTGSTQISNGTLVLKDTFAAGSRNLLSNTGVVSFVPDVAAVGTAGGTLQYLGADGQSSSEQLGPLLVMGGAGTVKVTPGTGGTANVAFANQDAVVTQTAATQTTAGSTITLTSTIGLVPGMRLNGGSAAATIVSITNGTQVVVSANQTFAAPTAVTFDRPNGGGTVNFAPDAGGSVTLGSVAAVGYLNHYSYFNGSDFVYAPATTNAVLRAPSYGTDAGFVVAGSSLSANNHNLVNGGGTSTGAMTVQSLKISGSHTVSQTGLLTIRTGAAGTGGGILVTGGEATISGSSGIATSGAGELVIRVNGSNDKLTLSAPITSASTGGLTKTGAGTLVIAGQNNYTTGGSTNLLEGTIQLVPGGRLSANSVNFNMRQNTIFDLNGVSTSQSVNTSSIGAFNGSGTVTNTSANAVTFAVGGGTTGGTGTFNGIIDEVAGRIHVIKMGTSNSQTWNGVSNYTGSTTIGAPGTGTTGILNVAVLSNINEPSGIGRGDPTNNAGSLIFGGTTGGLTYTGNRTISINREFTLAGTGAGAGGGLGASGVNNAAIIWNSTAPLTFATGNTSAQTLTLTGTSLGDNQVNLEIINNPNGVGLLTGVNKTGVGLWILGNAQNSYGGTTTIADGFLMAQDFASLPNASGVILGAASTGGVLQTSGTLTRNPVAVASTGANTLSWNAGGGGFAASSSKLIVALGGTLAPTALTWNTAGFIPGTGALLLNSTTALAEVEFRNAIDLNGAVRTITVNDNGNTFADFATITGVISNGAGTAAGISKAGGGTLQLLGANTYNGGTAVTAGILVVNSLGNSTAPATGTSVGTNIGANLQAQAITLGNATTGAAILQYVGSGETSDRMIRINTTTASTQIHADGTGPLVLTNVLNDMVAGAKALYLRGSNPQANMITSNLIDNGGLLSVVVDSGATWVLSGNNSYGGTTSVTAGALGAGHNNAFGSGALAPRNGAIFAYGGDRTLTNPISITTTSSGGTSTFMGDENLTLQGGWTYNNTTAGHVITNSIAEGKTLTLGGNMTLNQLTAAITLTVNGTGDTFLNGGISTDKGFGVNLSYTGSGDLTIAGVNSTGGATTVNNAAANVRVTGTGRLGTGALTVNAGSLSIESINHNVGLLTMGNVTGASSTITVASGKILTPTNITFLGTGALAATITGAGTLALGSSGVTVSIADNAAQVADMIWSTNTLTGSGTFIKTGAGTLDLRDVTNNQFAGPYQIDAGAILGLAGTTNNLILNGGVYEGSGTFTRSLGTGNNQVQWLAGGGGFAAVGANLDVTLSGAPNPLVWGGTTNFVPNGAPLIFGSSSATAVVNFTHAIDLNGQARTVSAVDNTGSTADKAVLSGVISNGSLAKTGNGVLELRGANTFSGGLTVSAGTLQFSTVSNNGGGASNLGQGSDGISMAGGTLSFIGDTLSQITNRAITATAAATNLSANGTNGATITYQGTLDLGTTASALNLTGTGGGIISGNIIQSGNAVDINHNSGTWTLSGTGNQFADDIISTGATAVLNLNAAGVLNFLTGSTSNGVYARSGATINVNANDVAGINHNGEIDYLILGDVGEGILNVNNFNFSIPRFDLGDDDVLTDSATINGTGTITVTVNTAGSGINLFRGAVNANLAGAGALYKAGVGDVTLRGNNSGLTGQTRIDMGSLILDYSANNNSKLNSSSSLDMRGGNLTVNGSTTANTIQDVASLAPSAGLNRIEVNSGTGRSATLNLGTISRAAGGGTVFFKLPASGAITTTSVNGLSGLLGPNGAGFAVVVDGTNASFATNDGAGNIIGVTNTAKNSVGSWLLGEHVTDETTGYSGTLSRASVGSIRFNAATTSTINLASNGALNVMSGGLLMTQNATGGAASILNGLLTSSAGEIIAIQDSASQTLTISSSILGTMPFVKSGQGTVVLSGNNDYSGATAIQSGTLVASGGNAIGDGSAVTLSDDQASTFRLLASETIGTLSGGNTAIQAGLIDIGGHTLSIRQGAAATYSGVITGSGNLVKSFGVNNNLQLLGASGSGFTGTVTVNAGLLYLTALGDLNGATAFTINKTGSFLIDNNGGTRTGSRISDSATFMLNSADGVSSTEVRPRGLWIRTDQDSTTSTTETIGALTLGSGASYATLEQQGGNNSRAIIIAADILRNPGATLDVRGRALGSVAATGGRAQLRIATNGNQVAFLNAQLVGGGGTGADISIVPWAIGENLAGALADNNMGNTLVTYINDAGFRALDFATEFKTYNGVLAETNNVRESLTSNLTGLSGKKINSLVLHNDNTAASSIGVTGTGSGQTLTISSGALLFTLNTAATASSAHSITLGGFDGGILTGATNEYIVHVVNPSAATTTATLTATLASPLNSVAASLTKSGRGTLILTEASSYTGGTVINEGVLQAANMAFLGTGPVTFAGGTFRLGPNFIGDLSDRTVTILTGGATIDTNGLSRSFANGLGNGGAGGLTKVGTGALTINGTSNYSGTTTISAGSLVMGANQAIGTGDLTTVSGGVLAMGAFNATVNNVTLADSSTVPLTGTGTLTVMGTMTVNRNAITPAIAGVGNLIKQSSQTVTLPNATNSYTGFTQVRNGILSLGSLANAGQNSAIGAPTGDNAAIRLGYTTTTGTLLYTGAAASSDRPIWLTGAAGGGILDNDGTGELTLSGHVYGQGAGAKSLTLQGTAGTLALPNVLAGDITELASTLTLIKAENGVWKVSGNNQFTGGTSINAGTLIAGHDSAFGSGTVTLNGGNLEGDGTARVFANALTITNASSVIAGSSALTINGALTSTVGLNKAGSSALTLGGSGSAYSGPTNLQAGSIILAGGGDNRLGSTSALTLGSGSESGTLQLGDVTGASNQTFGALATSGSGTSNAIIGGHSAYSTLTVDQTSTTTYAGALGGVGANQNQLHLVKAGVGQLMIRGTSTYSGMTTVGGGKLYFDTPTAFPALSGGIQVADGAELGLRGTSSSGNVVYGFAGSGNVITVGGTTGGMLGFGIDGAYNTQLFLASGQTMTVNGTLTTAVYVNNPPVPNQEYVLIHGSGPNSLHAGTGTFDLNPVVFNGGSFTYALSNRTLGGTVDQWVLVPTPQAAAANVWWKGDLAGIATGVWSASTTTGPGFPTNWDDGQNSGIDAQVPPDSGSIVHFSATGAANFATTLGANLTIQELIFHAGGTAISVGGANTLTIGNAVDSTGLTMEAGAPNVTFNAAVALGKAQTWNVESASAILSLTGGIGGTGPLTLNGNGTASGRVVLSGTGSSYTGATNVVAGRLVLAGGGSDRLPVATALTLGDSSRSAILQLGDAAGASDNTIGSLASGSFAGNAIVGGNATASTLTINQTGTTTYSGVIGGAGTNENAIHLIKTGSGLLILNGSNTYTGTTTVTRGLLRLGASGSISGTSGLFISALASNSAALDVNGRTVTLAGGITLTGANGSSTANIFDSSGGGTIALGGNITYDGVNDPLGSSIDAALTMTAPRTILANDSLNASTELTFGGTITGTGFTTDQRLTFDGSGTIDINNLVSISGSGADLQKNGTGTLNLYAATSVTDDWLINVGTVNAMVSNALNATDNVIIDGTGVQDSAIVNIGGTAGVSGVQQGNDFYIRNGGRVNVNVDNGISAGTDQLLIGDSASVGAAAAGRLHLAANITVDVNGIVLGASSGNVGNITGTGTITTGPASVRNGTIESGISLVLSGSLTKVGDGLVTLYGTRSGSGGTSIQEGELVLDYTINNLSKIGTTLTLGTAQGNLITNSVLTLNGSSVNPTVEAVASTTILPGNTTVRLQHGTGQITSLNMGAFTRTVVGGTMELIPSSNSSARSVAGIVPVLGYATLETGGLRRFASVDAGGNIMHATQTPQNDVTLWRAGQNIINTGGFTGAVGDCNVIASLTFDAVVAGTVLVGNGKLLQITSGGILVNEGTGPSLITGGSLMGTVSGPLGEIIVHQHNTSSSLTIASNIIRSAGITKSGAGTLVLSGSNQFLATGSQLTINEGVVQLNGGNAIGDSTVVIIRNGATLDLNNSHEVIGNLGVNTTNLTSGAIDIGTGSLTINQTASSSFTGSFSGNGNLIKNGAGVLTMNGLSTAYTGALIINQGQMLLNGANGRIGSTQIVLNGGELLNEQDQSSNMDRLVTGTITLNNTGGTNGLFIRSNQGNATRTDTIGVINLGFGHNVITAHGNAGNNVADLSGTSLNVGANHATALVRGNNLGTSTATQRGQIRFSTAVAGAVGGGTTTGTTINIIPWLIGDLSQTGLGNTFVTNTGATNGLRPLAAGEYVTDKTNYDALGAGVLANNVRFTTTPASLDSDTTGINALVLEADTAINISGPVISYAITSGAVLAAGAGNHSLGGFSALTTGGGRDYTVYVTMAASNLTISSALTSGVPLVKSGAGILTLTHTGNAFSSVYLNQGTVAVNDFDKLGSGPLNFAGGILRTDAGFTDDLGGKSMNLLTGGGTLDIGALNLNATNWELTGSGPLTKLGTGTLTIGNSSTISHSGLVNVAQGVLVLNNTLGNSIGSGGLLVSGASNPTTVRLNADNQIADTAVVEIRTNGSNAQALDLNNRSETLGSLILTSTSTTGVMVRTGATGVLTLGGDLIMNNNRVADGSTNEFQVLITGTGTTSTRTTTGILDLGGVDRRIVVDSSQVSTTARNDAVIETVVRNGGIIKEGSRALYLRAANTYSGITQVNNGALVISAANNLGDGSVTNTLGLAHGGILRSTGANVDLGVNRSVTLGGTGGVLDVTGTNILTLSGQIIGDDCTVLTKQGTGLLIQSGAGSFAGATTVSAGILQVGISGSGISGTGLVTVADGATLAGTGTIAGSTILGAGAVLQPGDVTTVGTAATTLTGNATLTFSQVFTTSVGSEIRLNISGSTNTTIDPLFGGYNVGSSEYNAYVIAAGSGAGNHDRLVLNGGLDFSGTITVTDSGFTATQGQIFNLLDWMGVTQFGNFNVGDNYRNGAADNALQFNLPDISSRGLVWDVSLFASNGIVVVVPEPGRATLLLMALAFFALRRRRCGL